MTSYVPETTRDLHLDLQCADEGDVIADPSLFGKYPNSPSFNFLGKSQRWSYHDAPEDFPIRAIDEENRSKVVLLKNSGVLGFSFDVTDVSDIGVLDWFFGDHRTSFKSKSFVFGRKPGGTEFHRILSGCIPLESTLTISESNVPLNLSGQMLVTNPGSEVSGSPSIGAGSFASGIVDKPVLPSDGGMDSFSYDSVNYKEEAMRVTVRQIYSFSDIDEAKTIQHAIPVRRQISGFALLSKKQGADSILADVLNPTPKTMSRVLLEQKDTSNGYKLNFSDIIFHQNTTNNNELISSDVLKEYVFEASELAVDVILFS
ncbi:hypothetical protein YTPLAS73_09040 [Nitrosarchaeum sp.]|nr:hypothetical protein YTPLAS73_09040 [Nitrosarchaeum sp.]